MRNPLRIFLWATVVAFSLPQAYSQRASSSDQDHQTAKKQSKQGKKAATELGDTRKEWLEQDARYIVTPAEREAFLKLGTNEEREQFIETFWRNRNPDPESPENSFKEEHHRRIAYANEHFASGVPGWRTDRGHIYILWGPPDEIEAHPSGGTYDRPMWQGGGSTTTYAWELWRTDLGRYGNVGYYSASRRASHVEPANPTGRVHTWSLYVTSGSSGPRLWPDHLPRSRISD